MFNVFNVFAIYNIGIFQIELQVIDIVRRKKTDHLLVTNFRCFLIGHTSIFVLIDFSLTVKAAHLIFISGRGSAISSAKQGRSSFIYNLVKS